MSRLRVSATALVVVALLLLASSSPADAQKKKSGKKSPKKNSKKRGASTRVALVQGDATWYDGISNGFCGFGSNLPADRFIVVSAFFCVHDERGRVSSERERGDEGRREN